MKMRNKPVFLNRRPFFRKSLNIIFKKKYFTAERQRQISWKLNKMSIKKYKYSSRILTIYLFMFICLFPFVAHLCLSWLLFYHKKFNTCRYVRIYGTHFYSYFFFYICIVLLWILIWPLFVNWAFFVE